MRKVVMCVKELVRNFSKMTAEEREKEACHIESLLHEAIRRQEEDRSRQTQKLLRENARLRTLLNVAAEHIQDLEERVE